MEKECIYTITTMTKCEPGVWFADCGDTRVVAYYFNYEDAYQSVIENNCDMWETCYDYAVIEEVEPGMYPYGKPRWFFKYDKVNEQYQPIEEPECVKNLVNFSIG